MSNALLDRASNHHWTPMGLRVFKRTQYGIGAGLRPQEGKFSLRHENNRTWPWAHAKFCGTHAMRGSDVNKFSTVDSFSTPLRQLGREPGLLTVQIGNTQMTCLRGSPAANDRVSVQLMWCWTDSARLVRAPAALAQQILCWRLQRYRVGLHVVARPTNRRLSVSPICYTRAAGASRLDNAA